MKCGFDKEYSKLYSILPSNDEESFCFDNRTFQLSNTTLETEKLVALLGSRYYGESVKLDMVMFCAEKETFAKFGLCLLSFLFSQNINNFEIHLTNKESNIKTIKLFKESFDQVKEKPGFSQQPLFFRYWPEEISYYPFGGKNICPNNFPELIVEHHNFNSDANSECSNQGNVKGLGTNEAMANFAQLLLNFGSYKNSLDEVHLESFPGVQGAGVRSAEISLLLPNSDWS